MNGAKTYTALTAVVAVLAILWTLAAAVTLVYWSGLTLWVVGLLAAAMFVWTIRVYLRPSETRTGV